MHQKKQEVFKVLAAAKAKEILEYLNDHEDVRYRDLNEFINPGTLNERLYDFDTHGLLVYRELESKRKLYNISEKGKKVLECLHGIERLVPGNEEEVFHLLSLKYVLAVLEFVCEHGETKYADMENDFTIHSIRIKVGDLIRCGLLQLCIERRERRKEWFEITEEGKKTLQIVDDLAGLFKG